MQKTAVKISCGVFVVDDSKSPTKILLVKRTTTFAYSEFMNSKFWDKFEYVKDKTATLIDLMSQMTRTEQQKISTKSMNMMLSMFGPELKEETNHTKKYGWYKHFVPKDCTYTKTFLDRYRLPPYFARVSPPIESAVKNYSTHVISALNYVQKYNLFKEDLWELPKGHLNKGEFFHKCALRELEEETFLKQNDVQFIDLPMLTAHITERNTKYYCAYYVAEIKNKQKIHTQNDYIIVDNCVAQSEFIPINHLEKYNLFLHKEIRDYLAKYFKI